MFGVLKKPHVGIRKKYPYSTKFTYCFSLGMSQKNTEMLSEVFFWYLNNAAPAVQQAVYFVEVCGVTGKRGLMESALKSFAEECLGVALFVWLFDGAG